MKKFNAVLIRRTRLCGVLQLPDQQVTIDEATIEELIAAECLDLDSITEVEHEDLNALTVAELKDRLTALGVTFGSEAKKAELVALLQAQDK